MICLRISPTNLLEFYLICSMDYSGFCLDMACPTPKPSISHPQSASDRQSLLVSWLVNHTGLMLDIYEIQVGRTEAHTVIYSENVSLSPVDPKRHTWAWSSDLPLECVDHSVRMRLFCNGSVPSPWSHWEIKSGAQETDKAQIFPFQQVLRQGSAATFCCVPPRGDNITLITYNGSIFNRTRVGARVESITVNKLTARKTAVLLSCSVSKTTKPTYTSNYVSFPPQKLRNLSCITTDLTAVDCTWVSSKDRQLPTRYKQTYTLHIENSEQSPITCEPSSCTFPAVPQLEEYNISVVVRDELGEEMETYSFNISDRVLPVVKLGRVSPGVTESNVSWIVLGDLTRLGLLCQVTADPHNTTEVSCNTVNGLCEVTLLQLLPNTVYSSGIRCSANGRLWGDWSQSRPYKTKPLVTLDVWRRMKQLPDLNSRQVTLLWIPHSPGSAEDVSIQRYTVQWKQDGQNWTAEMTTGLTRADVSIGPERYDFVVQAVLPSGSAVPAHITVPQRDDEEMLPVEKWLSSNTDDGFNLSWDQRDTATCGFTVEWCILGNANPSSLQWMKVPKGTNKLLIPKTNPKAGNRYSFNIYECTEEGHRLMEIQTEYSQELNQPPRLVQPVERTSYSVRLEWCFSEDDPSYPAFITGFLVTVQEVTSNTLADVVNMKVGPQTRNVTIENLQPNTEYALSVKALTKEGSGLGASINVTTKTDYSSVLAKILAPILLLLCCTILLWPHRKILEKGLRDMFVYPAGMNIKTPELDSFLHETTERLQSQTEEDCTCCDIEILRSTSPPMNGSFTPVDPQCLSTLPPAGCRPQASSMSLTCVLPQRDYCPQAVTLLWDSPVLQEITCMTNKTYFHMAEEDLCEEKVMNDQCENLQEPCSVIYGYISSEALKA